MNRDFQPKIIVFCCNWCAYAGADLAGVSRFQIKTNFRTIRTMCSGRIDPELILRAFQKGADGVMVAGCHLGDCHYIDGNYKTRRRIALLSSTLEQLGLDSRRLRLEWISAGEGEKFQRVINQFIDEVHQLGPSPLGDKEYGRLSRESAE
ncbi:methyl-viologen-reducing hydrogenase subunit delta [candidate division TA06 bacterium DG_26]|uniref:Methyl-viologen-reducing hydrogenase subunit delta n=1 Tax=candidate division TA06 bacterium DG_26 TaxID=1703771 RepID=A0A0S7WHD3_UNCT6|nr:MAG: methyl-viologen-reducing hydrogenase subunit delta [candidate division TA06 bacterium DG_26]